MDQYGGHRNHYYGNLSLWSADFTDPNSPLGGQVFHGTDFYWTDDSAMVALSSHGTSRRSATEAQIYYSPACNNAPINMCSIDSRNIYLGETPPMFPAYDSNGAPRSGNTRWLVLATCYSVDTYPAEQWSHTFVDGGLDAVIGFRGPSTDGSTTDELLEDFVYASVASPQDTLKVGWFYAVDDWWVDDTGSLIVGGTSTADSTNRRDNLKVGSAKRPAGVRQYYWAWSWYTG